MGSIPDSVRKLGPGDERALFGFLDTRLESSLFLLGNAERAGLADRGEPFQGTYVGYFSAGELSAVAAHYWNGVLIVQGEVGLEEAALSALRGSGRKLSGLIGPRTAREQLGTQSWFAEREVRSEKRDLLFSLDLTKLRVPALLEHPNISVRAPTAEEVRSPLAAWRVAYVMELFAAPKTPELERAALTEMEELRSRGDPWVLCERNHPVAFTAFNVRTRGIVQVGGVWTPPDLRGRGFARAAVAHSLLEARKSGALRSTLFTGEDNLPAQCAYRALGYEPIAEFSLVFFN